MTELDYETVRVEREDAVCVITLDRPDALNALNDQMKSDLAAAIGVIRRDDQVRVLVLTGKGRAFCAGGDINSMDPDRPAHEQFARTLQTVESVTLPLARLEKPVIAAVNGHAHGGGMSLALSSDIVLASDDATFSLAFVRVGLVADMGSLYFLPRLVGPQRAKEIAFSGAALTAREAADLGLVSRVLPKDSVLDQAMELAQTLAEGPPVVYAFAKRLIDQSSRMTLDEVVQTEALMQAVAYSTPELAKRTSKFRQGREESS